MTMQTLRETDKYALVQDRLMGVVRYIRKSDNAVTPMMTGAEAEFYLEETLPLSDAGFNAEAETLEYS